MNRIKNFNKIDENLSTSGQPTKNELLLIAEEGFEVIINTRPQLEMSEVFDEGKIVKELGMKYFQIETALDEPDMDELAKFLELMEKFAKNKVFLHCRANKRASGLLAIYRVVKLGWSEEDAIKKVKEVWELTPGLQNFIEIQIDYITDEKEIF